MSQRNAKPGKPQAEAVRARLLCDLWFAFLSPWLRDLKRQLDRRLVRSALGVILALVIHRNRPRGLLLSELGGYLLSAFSELFERVARNGFEPSTKGL